MSYYTHHVFFCSNVRDDGRPCCGAHAADEMRNYAKDRVRELGLKGPRQVRINKAGCMDRCEEGPVLVVYPDNVWYTWVDRDDVDEIIHEHLLHGRIVERLRLPD